MKGGISMFNFIKDMFKLFNKPNQKEKDIDQFDVDNLFMY